MTSKEKPQSIENDLRQKQQLKVNRNEHKGQLVQDNKIASNHRRKEDHHSKQYKPEEAHNRKYLLKQDWKAQKEEDMPTCVRKS